MKAGDWHHWLPDQHGVQRDKLEEVTLVDEDDNDIGSCGKLPAHRDGRLHRAFSILITNPHGEFLMQRRAPGKYHFAGLWSNSCCGHPRPGEATRSAAERRLGESTYWLRFVTCGPPAPGGQSTTS